jgi:hypothetical protein
MVYKLHECSGFHQNMSSCFPDHQKSYKWKRCHRRLLAIRQGVLHRVGDSVACRLCNSKLWCPRPARTPLQIGQGSGCSTRNFCSKATRRMVRSSSSSEFRILLEPPSAIKPRNLPTRDRTVLGSLPGWLKYSEYWNMSCEVRK